MFFFLQKESINVFYLLALKNITRIKNNNIVSYIIDILIYFLQNITIKCNLNLDMLYTFFKSKILMRLKYIWND